MLLNSKFENNCAIVLMLPVVEAQLPQAPQIVFPAVASLSHIFSQPSHLGIDHHFFEIKLSSL